MEGKSNLLCKSPVRFLWLANLKLTSGGMVVCELLIVLM